jgi:hypothetical protein
MSGLGELGEFYNFNVNAGQVSQKDIDQYDIIQVDNPVANYAWYGSASGTVTASTAITKVNQLADHPRNFCYSITGITNGTYGGTFTVNGVDQFGVTFQEVVSIGTAVNGGTTYGTAIAAKFISGSFISSGASGTFIGTANLGLGTAANGSASSNWFGLLTKIAGTSDVKMLTWNNNGTITTLNKGTAIGTLIGFDGNGSVPSDAFQGTSGVAITDHYKVVFKPTYDNTGKGTMSNL